MSIENWISRLAEQGLELWFEGDRVRYRAPKGALGAEDRTALSARRAEVLEYLRRRAAALPDQVLPLSYSQQSLWFLHEQARATTAYHVALSARIGSAVDVASLRQAIQALVDRHASLRTTYGFADGTPRQRIAGEVRAALAVVSTAGLDEAELKAAVFADYRQPFDLEHGPVLRATLFTRDTEEHVLLIVVHHIAADGWSLLMLFEELLKLYGEATGGPLAALPRPTVTYSDYAAWQEQMLAGPEGERLWTYWREKLAPPRPALDLPIDRPRPPLQGFRGSSLSFKLDSGLTDKLKQLARAEATTPFVVLLATFQAFLHRATGAEDVIVGTPMFARSKPEFMRVVGDFVNSVPLRGKLAPSISFRELVGQLRRALHEALDAQELPFPLLVRRLQPVRDPSRAPIFDTFFLLQRFEQFRDLESLLAGDGSEPPIESGGLRLSAYPLDQQEGQFELALQMVERGGLLHAVLKYSTDVFNEATIRHFADDYLQLTQTVAANPDALLGSLPGERRESVAALIERLRTMDIRLLLEGERLRVNAPKGAVGDELKAAIAARRDEIVAVLRAAPSANALPRISRDGYLPLSAAQQRLWFLDRMDPGQSQYNIGFTIRFRGALDAGLLQRALEELSLRHELLRSRIGERDGEPLLEILPAATVALEVIDLSGSPGSIDEAQRLCAERLRAPYDLARGPLASYLLVRSGPDDAWFAAGMHHAIGDGWSLMLAARELCLIYDALASGGVAPLAPLAVQYVDYAAWEREQLRSGKLSHQLGYWKQQLAGAPALLELPTDRPRPAAQSFRGHALSRDLDARLLEAIKQLAREHDATLFMTLLAVWQVLLARYSGQEDIVVGSPMANRDRVDLEGIVGCFVNNIVLRTRIEGNPTFAELLAQVKSTTLGAFDNRDLPFDVLVEALRPERNTAHAPIFQTLFTLHSFPMDFVAPRGLHAEILGRDTDTARFDLSFEAVETGGKLAVFYEYASDLFDEPTILRMHAHVERLLAAAAADPGRRVHDVPLLTADDELLLGAWNETALEHERGRCVHQLLEASARATPDAIAVVDAGGSVTYRALDERANRLAQLLVRRGVTPGSLVAVCVDRTADMPVAIAAVLKAGAAYVPLDPTHPGDRLRYILDDAGVACAVTLSRFATLLDGARAPLILLDERAAELDALPAMPPEVSVAPEDRAYVIYTSGSTGRPKGVEVEHRNVVAFMEAMRREPGFAAHDALLAVTTLSFDIAGLEMWLPLMVGGRIVVASRGDVLDGERLMAMLEEHGITVMQATPATWRLLLEAGWAGKRDLKILCGGEPLPRDLAAALVSRVAELWNMYGPTETTIWSTLSKVEDPGRGIFIGRPIASTRVYVLDRCGQLAPIGVPGELCIGGEGVARGYHDRPELTADRFVTVTLPGGRVERVYKTGDVARFRGDGQLEFLGRRDHQVKVRGYRIELGEIEAVLGTHAGLKQHVVAVREDTPGDQRLVGYVVPVAGVAFDPEAARATLRAKLPEYMVPNQFMVLESLPLTPNGKIDRNALPAPEAPARRSVDDGAEVLMTPAQRRVAAIWRDLLRADRVGLHDNFFELGGHSLLLAKLHAALRRELGADIGLVELFQYTTVAAQAERLAAARTSDTGLRRAQARAAKQISHG